jgi:hypothetical protein
MDVATRVKINIYKILNIKLLSFVYVRTGVKIRLVLVLKVLKFICVSSSLLPACPFCQFSCLTVANVRSYSWVFLLVFLVIW